MSCDLCYTGLNSKPFKISDSVYQLKCYSAAPYYSTDNFHIVYLEFDLNKLNVLEEDFLKLFISPYILEFTISYEDFSNTIEDVIKYENPKIYLPDKYTGSRYTKLFRKLQTIKPQDKEKIWGNLLGVKTVQNSKSIMRPNNFSSRRTK